MNEMKNKSFKITLNYIITITLITLITIALNYAIILYIVRFSSYIDEPKKTVEAVAEELNKNNNKLSLKTSKMIKSNNLWIQLVNPVGKVIYSYNKPMDIADYYSLKDIAKLSRSYLKDYPVLEWESKVNLVILGYPKNSLTKYNWFIPTNNKASIPMTIVYIILLNVIITILVSICLGRIFSKPLRKMINGVFLLKDEKEVSLKEKGIYRDLAQSINETSKNIVEKNIKIKLHDNAVKNWINSISHDVRTPLSMILGYSAMIGEDKILSNEVQEQSKIITENSLRLKELITTLNLSVSLEYNMQPLTLTQAKLSNIVREAMVSSINSGVLKQCSTEIVIEYEEIAAMVDEKLIIRALINIIMNSAKHNKDGCHITATVKKVKNNDSYASIIISDDGEGISEEKIKKLNKQEDFNTHINQEHGLGLIIVKNIIKAHNGKFIIEKGKKKGVISTITIYRVI